MPDFKKPAPPIARLKQASSDYLRSIEALDAAEARARAAKLLADEAERRATELEAELQLERERGKAAELQRQLDVAIEASKKRPVVEIDRSTPPPKNGVTAHVFGKKIPITFAAIATAIPVIWAGVQNYNALMQQFQALNAAISNDAKVHSDFASRLDKLERDNTALREVVAKQAGFLEGALPSAGVKAKAASGAIQVDVETDPLPPGTRPRKLVNVTTPIPAPAPRQ